jgi:hypothetical protein
MEVKKISMDIPVEDYDWLKSENINMTELFKGAIENLRYRREKKVAPLMFLVSIMGIVFSIALIGIGLLESPIHVFTRAFLCALGGFLAITTTTAYIRNKRQ